MSAHYLAKYTRCIEAIVFLPVNWWLMLQTRKII